MSESVALRVLEIVHGEWVVQFEGGLAGWTTFSDTFVTEAEAMAFEAEQIARQIGDVKNEYHTRTPI